MSHASSFLQTHANAFRVIAGRGPSAFERATGEALWEAYRKVACESRQSAKRVEGDRQDSPLDATRAFVAVSAATGSGKTVGACALIAHLSPAPCAFVIR